MQHNGSLLTHHTQNENLAIRIVTPDFGHLSTVSELEYGATHRNLLYYFLFMIEGSAVHKVDLNDIEVSENQLLLVLPHQIHQLPVEKRGKNYFKIGFDENCLSLLPSQYPFLSNPFNKQLIHFSDRAVERLKATFAILLNLLKEMSTQRSLILAHLNGLMAEINVAYFNGERNPADEKLGYFLRFKLLIEEKLTDHLAVEQIAEKLNLNTNSLYAIVKHYSTRSPKAYLTKRLILEAKRRLYYSESSVKELAFDLGYNDPEYFARVFKKETGQTISAFLQDLSGK